MYNVTFKFLPNVTFQFSPVAFTLPGTVIFWGGIVIAACVLIGVLCAFIAGVKKQGFKSDALAGYGVMAVIFAAAGVLLYFIITKRGADIFTSSKEIYWYGIIITLGIVLSVLYAFWRAKKLGVKTDDMYDYAIFVVIFGVIGARLYYVLTNLGDFKTFSDVIALWNGGLAIYGGIIAGALTVLVVSLIKKINPLTVLDAAAPATMIGQFIGRWGNYMNQEAFGCNTTLPWGMKSWAENNSSGNNLMGTVEYLKKYQAQLAEEGMTVDPTGYVHPTFLYESLWNIAGFILIHFLYKKRKFKGQMFLMYLTWYGFGRMLIETLRTDSLYIPGTELRISMVVGFVCFIAGVVLLTVFTLKAKKNPPVLETPIADEPKRKTDGTEYDTSAGDGVGEDEVNELCALDGDDTDADGKEEDEEETPDGDLTALDGEDKPDEDDREETDEENGEDTEDGDKN